MRPRVSITRINLLGFVRQKTTKSSTNWLARQARDPYVKQRSSPDLGDHSPLRARSAFKLVEVQKKYRILYPGQVVCDLGAAPGGWSQIAAKHLKIRPPAVDTPCSSEWLGEVESSPSPPEHPKRTRNPSKLIAVDLLPILPLPGVHIIRGDFTSPPTQARMSELVGERGVDVVLSDMCENISGNTAKDTQASLELCEMAFGFAQKHLRVNGEDKKSGILLMKYFEHPILSDFMKERLKPAFGNVRTLRLEASRTGSKERFFLCTGFRGA